jgi:hypothetical protein
LSSLSKPRRRLALLRHSDMGPGRSPRLDWCSKLRRKHQIVEIRVDDSRHW